MNSVHTKLHFHPTSKLVTDYFFVPQPLVFLLTLVKKPPMYKPVQVHLYHSSAPSHIQGDSELQFCCKGNTQLLWFEALFGTSEVSFRKKSAVWV